jgi:hypothetical protein
MPISGQLSPLDQITSAGRGNPVVEATILNSQNWVSENFPLASASAGVAVTSQMIHAIGIPLQAGQIVQNVLMANLVAAAGTLPTSVEVGLASPAGVVVQKSANTLTSLAQQGLGVNAFPLSAAYAVPTTGLYYAYFLQNGTFGTTQPTPVKTYATAVMTAGQTLFGSYGTSQTTVPAVGTALGTAAFGTGPCFWIGVN